MKEPKFNILPEKEKKIREAIDDMLPDERHGIIEDIINDFNKCFTNKAKINYIKNNQIEITIGSVSMQILMPCCIGISSKG